jgi:hypothetical protein
MKTRSWRKWLAATLVIFASTGLRAAEAEEPKPANTPGSAEKLPIVITNAAAQSDRATTVVNNSPIVIPPKLSLPPLLDQVVRLSQSGSDENVVRAYVEKAAPAYRITGNEIIQLQEMGVPKGVILSLIEHSKDSAPSGTEPVADTTPAAAPAPANPPPETVDEEAVNDYRDALAPYGTWIEVADYGWCWQPTVVVVNPSWRPYCDSGYWRWSDAGWYWHSQYSWGWAPFHYGRWFSHPHRGWVWCPDRVWGPAWVSWRSSGTHCGWAPLPPGAHFLGGLGWHFRGARVGADCTFGLTSAHFNFVPHERFIDRHVATHCLRGHEARTVFAHGRVANNYSVDGHNRVINHGIGREQIAAATHTTLRPVSVASIARSGNSHFGAAGASASPSLHNTAGSVRPGVVQPSRSGVASIARHSPATASGSASAARVFPNQSRAVPNYSAPQQTHAPQYRSGNVTAIPRSSPTSVQVYARRSQPAAHSAAPRSSVTVIPMQRSYGSHSSAARPSFNSGPSHAGTVSRAPSVSHGGHVSQGSVSRPSMSHGGGAGAAHGGGRRH